ncbi:MAG: Hsp20/alpha crystallin family protein [Candidatus Aenigmarchaeota archaeon]|nr:Hsp20/alpha crystallin family protein [Candidatus Aenigmarchaeota archaeon]
MKKGRNFRFYWEKPKGGDMKIEMPGFRKDEISVKMEGGMLTVSAEKKSHRKEKGKGFYKEEASFSSFSRSVSMPEGAGGKDFEVDIEDGAVKLKRKKKVKN